MAAPSHHQYLIAQSHDMLPQQQATPGQQPDSDHLTPQHQYSQHLPEAQDQGFLPSNSSTYNNPIAAAPQHSLPSSTNNPQSPALANMHNSNYSNLSSSHIEAFPYLSQYAQLLSCNDIVDNNYWQYVESSSGLHNNYQQPAPAALISHSPSLMTSSNSTTSCYSSSSAAAGYFMSQNHQVVNDHDQLPDFSSSAPQIMGTSHLVSFNHAGKPSDHGSKPKDD
ncbi:hypothetical protein COLO4_13377 [Corchorus olitorius]|uniref:Uncharacterized protein n=1 Tax=Corchorus olitorius TaxID=93759 RepID=A0A1R3JX07_9ROSI|nr:hypothetical protein COLO4_13377 [Corchorus olitorius]